jgi:hypothetical protein
MGHSPRFLLCTLLCLAGSGRAAEAWSQASESPLDRALNRAVTRINRRADLQAHRPPGFDRDSLDTAVFLGLGKAEDSTIFGWFTGFSTYINGTDSTACLDLTKGEPTGSALATHRSTMDSSAIERWMVDWESAVVASYLAAPRPPVNEEEMMMAVFALIAKLPETEISLNRKPTNKPRKLSAEAECRTMRDFFGHALQLEEPTRMTLLRGLAQVMKDRPDLPGVEQQ